MKRFRGRWTLVAVALVSVAVISFVASRTSPRIDGLAFTDADEVKLTLNAEDLDTQDSLFAKLTSRDQFFHMSADEQTRLFAVANSAWYKESVLIGYSIDRRGRDGYGANGTSPVLVAVQDGTVTFAGCLGPQN